MGQLTNDQIVGIILIVLGALLLFGPLALLLAAAIGVGLMVVGILILTRNLKGPAWLGATCLVLGILVVLPSWSPVEKLVHEIVGVLIIVVAVILLVLGILKLIQKP